MSTKEKDAGLNESAIRRMVISIERNPKRWNPDVWVEPNPECGTMYCAAGWAVHNAGLRIDMDSARIASEGEYHGLHVAEVGRTLLGLTAEQAEEIFYWGEMEYDQYDEPIPPSVEAFKEHLTEVTGVTFEPVPGG